LRRPALSLRADADDIGKGAVIGLFVAGLLGLSVVRLARAKTLSALLQLFGACCLIIVVLTHIAEALHIWPSMGWESPTASGTT
jgi:hypothetical protein